MDPEPTQDAQVPTADVQAAGVRQRAVAGVAELYRRVTEAGRIDLPTLTREELRTMGDRGVVPDEADLAWWRDLGDEVREQVASAAARGLLARGLVAAQARGERIPGELAPELVLVLATRRSPAAVLSVSPVGGFDAREPRLQGYLIPPEAEPVGRASGAATTDAEPPGLVLLEQVDDGLHRLELCIPAAAAERLVRWLSSGSGSERVLDVIRAGSTEAASLRVVPGRPLSADSVLALLTGRPTRPAQAADDSPQDQPA